MITARETLSSIERAILGVRSEENQLAAVLQSLTDEAGRLRAQQAENFKALATIRLDALSRDQVVGKLDLAERRALELLERHREALASAAARRSQATEAVTAAEAEHAAKAAAVEEAGNRIDELAARVETEIRNDPAWIAQQEHVARAEAVAKAGADKAAQAEADRESKGKPYENDPLFMYLWRSGYGTAAYRAGPIVRYFDGKVAKIVGYEPARANYQMLTEIPLRLREHANRLADQVESELTKRCAVERSALEAEGIVALETALDSAEDALQRVEARLSQAKAELSALDAEQNAGGESGRDAYYRQAVGILAEELGRADLRALYQRALQTPTPSDDRIVQSLQEGEKAILRTDAQLQEVRNAATELARKRLELERSQTRFRQAGYDDPMGGFTNGDVIGAIIGGILKGALSSRNLEDALKDGFRRRQPRSNGSFGGGLRLPRGGVRTSSRPSAPPRSRDGFRTGGSF